MVRYIDLFCGIGSFHYSFQKLGFECVMACDISKPAKDTYKKNYDMETMGDIVSIDPAGIPEFDILCAGFPCQPFSNIGKHKGFEDERGTMFFQIMKIVKHHKPCVIVLENVAGLLKHENGDTFLRIKDNLEQENYKVTYKIMRCDEYGIPQMRKRLFIVCISCDIANKKSLNVQGILDIPKVPTPTLSTYLERPFEKNIAYTIRCGGRNSPMNDKHNWDGYIVNGKEYRLTVSDCLKLQGFESFELSGSVTQQYKLLGNTIPTNLTYIIGKKLLDTLFI